MNGPIERSKVILNLGGRKKLESQVVHIVYISEVLGKERNKALESGRRKRHEGITNNDSFRSRQGDIRGEHRSVFL